ncbi:outer membrane autotransporter [Lelliottia amnigena]|uniref:autotransporter outer membrane beta-barrel domain-containing protein n=1 Tax=Lelliottia amnigena TaxID=61646 RepID=UPI0009E65F8F|nr:autotransporter outer membrane beta-barrel domain-containing protein [Lelliottia amnigena]ATG01112.1 autotransporter outer membrane beta-barrel domain-containing protein [Lelliottia amnigena]PEG63549.1 autotransporter outer membrane beta-barrel domain-containing protein [Lelliottia amnigena]QXA21413.1 autotransporter outer membrane beta-barrel domain-containing protein [Lelliottia amnigena]VDZ89007.1 outer membrane autotransporter [Lelliottia amnigena]
MKSKMPCDIYSYQCGFPILFITFKGNQVSPILKKKFRLSVLSRVILCSLATPAVFAADYVINEGEAVLQLEAGSPMRYDSFTVSNAAGGTAALTINGTGNPGDEDRGKLSVDAIRVGNGTITVDNGASVTAYVIYVGNDYGTTGTGIGTMTVDNGASVTADDILVGYAYGSNYDYSTGTGTMTVDNGASVTAHDIYAGYGNGYDSVAHVGAGTMTVDNGASVTADYILVGYGETNGTGTGTMTVDNGASVNTEEAILVGHSEDRGSSYGTVTVSRDARLEADKIGLYNGILTIGSDVRSDALPVAAGNVTTNNVILASNAENNTAGQINFNHSNDDYVFNPSVTGTGFVSVFSGTTTLDGTNTYAGDTIIRGGTLRAGSDSAFSASSDFHMTQAGALDLNGISQTVGSLSSSGTTYFNQKGDTAGTVLTVNGDYHGSGGTLVFNSVLGVDDSVTDALHVKGNADGGTNVKVNNLGGMGSRTVEGIKLISVDGNVAEGTEFRQNGRIVAGAYDYSLAQRGNNWYLTSEASPLPPVVPGPLPVDPVDPTDPIKPVDPTLPVPPAPPVVPETPAPPVGPGKGTSISRPEAGSYIANQAASEMFFTRLEDRGREHIYTDVITGEKKQTSMWLRSEGRHLDSNDSSGQLSTRENRYAIQMGGDVTGGSFTGTDSWRLGVMAGYGNSHSNTRSDITGYQSKGDADGYTMGLYGTWFENADRRSGAWVDTWLQYAWFSNSVQGEGLAKEKYNAGGLQASVESGYAFVVPGGKNLDYIIEPQAQAIWNGVKADEFRESNGTVVKSEGTGNVHTRLGVKGSLDIRSGDKSGASWKPYMAVNWHHNTKEYGVKMDDVSLSVSGAKDTVELKAGVEGQLTEKLSVWGGVSGQAGSDSYRDAGGFLGVHYAF